MGLVGTWLLENPPPGYRPAGWTPPASAALRRDYSTREMLRTPQFYALWIAYALGTTAGQMTISQLVPFARSAGLGAAVATLALPVTAAGNAGGRILSGWLSDALGRLTTLRSWCWRRRSPCRRCLCGARSRCCSSSSSRACIGATARSCRSLPRRRPIFYGTRNLGLNYGVLFTAWGAAGIFGPMIGGRVFDTFGDYRYAFYAASALAVVAFGSLAMVTAVTN